MGGKMDAILQHFPSGLEGVSDYFIAVFQKQAGIRGRTKEVEQKEANGPHLWQKKAT